MSKKETAKRYILFIISLFFSAMGVALTKHGDLGVSPISSVANVLYINNDAIQLGTWLTIWNCALIVGQIVVLRKDFKPIQLLQIPLSFLFGVFTNLGMKFVAFIPVENYIVRILMVLCGVTVLGFGISLSVTANVILNSGEAFVKAISDKSGKVFGNVKVGFDVCCVVASIVLSLVLLHGSIQGTREGTIITALLTGFIVKFFSSRTQKPINNILID